MRHAVVASLAFAGAAAVALTGTGCDAPATPAAPATWVDDWRDEVVYQIVVDRFANGDPTNDAAGGVAPVPGDLARWQGGDWRGVRAHLDELAALGVTTLWISPVVAGVPRTAEADGYHGYWAADFTRLEPHFGDLAELRGLVDDAHARGMKVIADVVVNHVGRVFAYDLDGNGLVGADELEPPFATAPYQAPLLWLEPPPRLFRGDGPAPEPFVLGAEHFHRRGRIDDFEPGLERELGDFPTGLRDLATGDPEVAQALADTVVHWATVLDLDGLRLDAAPHTPPAFWARFAGDVRARLAARGKTRFLLLAEVWAADPADLVPFVSDGALDGAIDFPFKWGGLDPFLLDGRPAAEIVTVLAGARSLFPAKGHPGGIGLSPWQARLVFADNHDTRRVRGELDDARVAELAMTLVFTVDGIPCVYYGTEAELGGTQGHGARQPRWLAPDTTGTRMARHLTRLAELRRRERALRRGELVVRFASPIGGRESGPGAGLLAFERVDGDARVLVTVNGHPLDAASAPVPTGFTPGTRLEDALGDLPDVVVGEGGVVSPSVPPRQAAIWVAVP